ncbi:ABC transporter ATP-binding protein [Priestia koreensis]|uniref:ABC transporter n=1 Tax=Priestia koreensis TaxID=284581 RepID=A0A0M0L5Y0_9BACI|nr:ABC transporter ATP-binding protein [Priestia koreensis]KOO46073.1 ABC transporter [Priestia koreensis]
MNIIEINGIQKTYKRKKALRNVTCTIQGTFGLLGPNGAGKTTLMRILATLIKPDHGDIRFNDEVSWENSSRIRQMIGYLPQHFSLYKQATVMECLFHLAVLKGIPKKQARAEIEKLLHDVNLVGQEKTKMKHLSGGMLRRIGIAQALLGDPPILIVDEPTVGLDIDERVRFRQLLRQVGKNRIVLISTHIVEDVEETCDHIGILKDGVMLFTGSKDELKDIVKGKVTEKVASYEEVDAMRDRIISITEQGEYYLVRYLDEHGIHTVTPTIQDAYLFLTRNGENG